MTIVSTVAVKNSNWLDMWKRSMVESPLHDYSVNGSCQRIVAG